MSEPGDWNASAYDRVADPLARWGAIVLERLPLAGDERVLDAGCGTGRVTELLLERLPRGEVVALDASTAMLDEARRRLAPGGRRRRIRRNPPLDYARRRNTRGRNRVARRRPHRTIPTTGIAGRVAFADAGQRRRHA